MATYVHLDQTLPFGSYVYYFSNVDLADLVTLIDWSDEVSVQDLRAIGASLTQQSEVPAGLSPDEASALIEDFYGLKPADYVSPTKSKRPPKKRNENIVMGWYAEILPNNEWVFSRASYDKSTKTFRPFDDNVSRRPFNAKETIKNYMGGWKTPIKVINGELIGLSSGVFRVGKKIG